MRLVVIASLYMLVSVCACGSDKANEDDGGSASKSIACGAATCSEGCCPGEERCVSGSETCAAGSSYYMACDGPEDCPTNQVCCVSVGASLGGVDCSDMCGDTGIGEEVACHDSSDCPDGLTCKPSAFADVFVPTLLGCQQ